MIPSMSYKIDNINPEDKKRFIKNLFNNIVTTYDFLNHLLSFGMDILWRRKIFKLIHSVNGERVLDICCGTGDLSLLLTKHGARTLSFDFSLAMLQRGKEKGALLGPCVAADASRIPFADNTFSCATIAFGIRNIPDLHNFFREAYRILLHDGELVILELVRPRKQWIKKIYSVYLDKIIPLIGGVISGRMSAYKYLSKTIETFVNPEELKRILEQSGFTNVRQYPQTFGVASIIVCKKISEL